MITLSLSEESLDRLMKVVSYAAGKAPLGSAVLGMCHESYNLLADVERRQMKEVRDEGVSVSASEV